MGNREAQIRLYEPADAAAVASLGGPHGDARDGDHWRLTVVAEFGGRMAGAGTLGRNTMHRNAYWLEIDVDESSAGLASLGLLIYQELRRLRIEPWPVWWRADAANPERLEFAERAGFDAVVRCPMPRVDAGSAETRQWVADHANMAAIEVRTAESCTADELLDAWATYYEWAHADWFPVISRDVVRQRLATGLVRGLDRSLTTIAVRHERIVALAQVFPDVWDGRTTLICAETVQRDEPHGDDLVGAIIAGSLRRIADSGRARVDFEGHDIDPHYGPIAATLPAIDTNPLSLMRAE